MIDVDLLYGGTRHPNLAQMKMSKFCKLRGHDVTLLYGDAMNNLCQYDTLLVSKVFTFSSIPEKLLPYISHRINILNLDVEKEIVNLENNKKIGAKKGPIVMLGGTGFYPDGGRDLAYNIEHIMPDYDLYIEYIEKMIALGRKRSYYLDYLDYSIGFTTRGCFRHCSFCVNKKYDKCTRHAPVSEFVDVSRPKIYLWDDNVFALFNGWEDIFDELIATGKPFQFRQGLDFRLIKEKHIQKLSQSKYAGDYIFAFDHIEDKDIIIDKLKIWCEYIKKETKFYVLCAYDTNHVMGVDENLRVRELRDIRNTFERIKILMSFGCLPYVMRYEDYKNSEYKGIYTQLARWCNQPRFFKTLSFREYCDANQRYTKCECAPVIAMKKLATDAPDIAEKYFDLKFRGSNGSKHTNGIIDS